MNPPTQPHPLVRLETPETANVRFTMCINGTALTTQPF